LLIRGIIVIVSAAVHQVIVGVDGRLRHRGDGLLMMMAAVRGVGGETSGFLEEIGRLLLIGGLALGLLRVVVLLKIGIWLRVYFDIDILDLVNLNRIVKVVVLLAAKGRLMRLIKLSSSRVNRYTVLLVKVGN